MWSKISNALKPRQAQDQSNQGDIMNKVLEQHPNLSVFVPSDTAASTSNSNPSPPPSPSKSNKRSMLKRLSKVPPKEPDSDGARSGSLRLSKKTRPPLQFNTVGSNSQLSVALNSPAHEQPATELSRRASFDMLKSSQNSTRSSSGKGRSSLDILRRPSLDMLRTDNLQLSKPSPTPTPEDMMNPPTPALYDRLGSVRSILREPNTPGTGQNVRFFSRDAYKYLSPEQSMDTEDKYFSQIPVPPPKDEPSPFLDRLNQSGPDSTSTPAALRNGHSKSNSKSSRPSAADIFSSFTETPSDASGEKSMSLSSPMVPNKSTDLFDISQPLNLPAFPPSGLNFDVNSHIFDQSMDLDSSFNRSEEATEGTSGSKQPQLTSTPFRKDMGSSKEASKNVDSSNDVLQVPATPGSVIDETIFHSTDVPPRLPTPLHERSQSFSLGKTVFYSMADIESRNSSNISAAYASSDLKESSISTSSTSSKRESSGSGKSAKTRARALSESMLQNILRAADKGSPPEADINDESSDQLQVYAPPEPDPFSANAATYYTPQTMIPVTPPKQSRQHLRTTSKEESLIFSFQTQLTIQAELCQQYEVDLRARDELVETLTGKLVEAEKDDSRRRATLRSWKKKVQELERICRQLEEEVDDSRQASFERSIMDEASGEALRMLHRQIAALEREKADQTKREDRLKEELARMENAVQDKSEEAMLLKEMLWTRDENSRQLEAGLIEAKEQMEMLGNVSVGVIDEEELRRLMSEKQQANYDDQTRQRAVEATIEQEKAELVMKLETLQVEKAACEEELEKVTSNLKNRDEEFAVLKSELEAQWVNTEAMGGKIETLEREKLQIEAERETVKKTVEDLESKITNMELEWNESTSRKAELENQLEEMWHTTEALEKDRDLIDRELQQAEEQIETLKVEAQEHDQKVAQLEEEAKFSKDLADRAQETVRKRDAEIDECNNQIVELNNEMETLRDKLSTTNREFNRLLDEQSRLDQSVSNQEADLKTRMELVIKERAQAEVDLKTSRDQVEALRDEVERLRRQVQALQQVSADADVEIEGLKKKITIDKQDLEGINIALDSKQQELELIKRQLGVKGTAGATPAKPTNSKTHRRDSSIFTATPTARPPSSASDRAESASAVKQLERKSSAERPPSSASATRPPSALSRSSRVNTTATSVSGTRAGAGSMGPPANPTKPRASIASSVGTPTPKPLGRSSSVKPSIVSPTGTPLPHRRVSSAIVALEQRAASTSTSTTASKLAKLGRVTSPVSSVPERDEKENVDDSFGTVISGARRRVPVPTS